MRYSDKDILRAIKSGNDDKALSFLYQEVLPKVKYYIGKNKGNEDEAKDIFQDAVLIFYKKVKQHEFNETANITSFICLVAKNLWINRVKKINRNTELPEIALTDSGEDLLKGIIREEKRAAIKQLLSDIGEECKKLLKLSVYENKSMKEICEVLGYSNENVAKTYNYRCKQKLIQIVLKNKAIASLLKNEF